jgi:uncharacterized protein YyaL (SSP411 family)
MPNRLARETSPYLLQHAANPVDWYPWGEEAFARARAEDKPILLSVGYSSCHWCHVMAHESFEDEATARLMNDWFVNIKVDREERPDIDGVYMAALQAMTGQGGWPMTVFMTPDGRPFYTGTYFPPSDGHGRPGFPRVLEALHDAWVDEHDRVLQQAEGITDHLRAAALRTEAASADVDNDLARTAVGLFREAFDATWGGFGGAPKFPSPGNLEFLLAHAAREQDAEKDEPASVDMALLTLQRMAQGGMYDHLGGGFSRYSVDQHWLVPHFEKMLYDNAQLARVYLHAFQLTGEPFYERVVRETLDYLSREMRDPEGGFYSAQDADSERIEGKYFVWTVDEVERVLGPDAPLFCASYGVTLEGNFRDPHHPELTGRNVLTDWTAPEDIARQFDLPPEALAARLSDLRLRLFAERETRVKPGLDDKVLTSWNGLPLAAFAEAARVLDNRTYRELAEQNAAFFREQLWRDGTLLHTYKAGVAKVDGLLEDYACYALGLIELFKLTGDLRHLEWARELFESILERFHDDERGGFFETAANAEPLLIRQKSLFDSATPSGNGAVALLALWLSRYYNRKEWEQVALEVVGLVQGYLRSAPTGFGSVWQAVELLLAPHQELAIVGAAAARAPLEREAAGYFLPWLVIAPSWSGEGLPLFEGRAPTAGAAAAYLCQDMVCQLPAATPEELARQLAM